MKIVAIILARGGSKGIPKKNIINFCGKPLIVWTIEQCLNGGIEDVFVSSDSKEILSISKKCGAYTIERPEEISTDYSTSESGLLHSLNYIEKKFEKFDWVFSPQVTSPIRTSRDISTVIDLARKENFDSMLSVVDIEDHFIWEKDKYGGVVSVNYDFKNRKRRQDIPNNFLENGSFYLFKPQILKIHKNRLGGKISFYKMEKHKMFQIDNLEDLRLCEVVMKGYDYA